MTIDLTRSPALRLGPDVESPSAAFARPGGSATSAPPATGAGVRVVATVVAAQGDSAPSAPVAEDAPVPEPGPGQESSADTREAAAAARLKIATVVRSGRPPWPLTKELVELAGVQPEELAAQYFRDRWQLTVRVGGWVLASCAALAVALAWVLVGPAADDPVVTDALWGLPIVAAAVAVLVAVWRARRRWHAARRAAARAGHPVVVRSASGRYVL